MVAKRVGGNVVAAVPDIWRLLWAGLSPNRFSERDRIRNRLLSISLNERQDRRSREPLFLISCTNDKVQPQPGG